MTQKEILVLHLRERGNWVKEYELYRTETRWGWLAPSAPRRVRELVADGILERRMNGRYAEVRFKGQAMEFPPTFEKEPERSEQLAISS